MTGSYIVFEGCDKSGKSTLSKALYKCLKKDHDVILTKHPGATNLGGLIRMLVKDPRSLSGRDISIPPKSAQLLMMADQAAFIDTILVPSLDEGKMVMADRSNFISAVVYGWAEGIDLESLERIISCISSPIPDLVFLLDASYELVKSRKSRKEVDRFEDAGDDFSQRICDAYHGLATGSGDLSSLVSPFLPSGGFHVLEASQEPQELLEQAYDAISSSCL